MSTATTSLTQSHSRLFATVDHCLNSVKGEVLAILERQKLPTDLPADPAELDAFELGFAELIQLYCFCDLADCDLDGAGLREMPDTYEHFRTGIYQDLVEEQR